MTGYANRTIQLPHTSIQVDIRSVNHRFFDLSIKSPDEFRYLEHAIREKISSKIQRGKIDIRIHVKDSEVERPALKLNTKFLESYTLVAQQIATYFNEVKPASIAEILALPGVLSHDTLAIDTIEQAFLGEIDSLTSELLLNQQTEGDKLSIIILEKLTSMEALVVKAQQILPTVLANYVDKLKQKLMESFAETEISEQRCQQEFAYFCQKIDVDEELLRLDTHIKQMKHLIKNGGIVGKKIDFLTQEMHREANTFGAKSVALQTTELSLELKVLTEQIKEQIQNIM